jgi:hypothetical protein
MILLPHYLFVLWLTKHSVLFFRRRASRLKKAAFEL